MPVYLGQVCLAGCLQGSHWKEFSGLHLQPKQQPFCFPPALPSRAWTTDRSRVQTPAPVHNTSVLVSMFLKYFKTSTHSIMESYGATGGKCTFFLMSDITPIRVSTCCLDKPSRGTPSAKVSAPSAPGSQRCRIKRETQALQGRFSYSHRLF